MHLRKIDIHIYNIHKRHMFSRFAAKFAREETVSLREYVKVHTRYANNQINFLNGIVIFSITGLGWAIDSERKHVDKRFEQVDKRFEQVDKRFEQVEKRIEDVASDVKDIKIMLMQNAKR